MMELRNTLCRKQTRMHALQSIHFNLFLSFSTLVLLLLQSSCPASGVMQFTHPSDSDITTTPPTFFGVSDSDTIEFQTLFSDASVCDAPRMILADRLDSHSYFLSCSQSVVRMETSVNYNGTLGQTLRLIAPLATTVFTQIADEAGNLLIFSSNNGPVITTMFYISDRLGLSPLRPFLPQSFDPNVEIIDVAVDKAVDSSGSSVYFIEQSFMQNRVMRLRVNQQSPNQSTVEEVILPLGIDSRYPKLLHVQPDLHLMHVIYDSFILEHDLVANSSLVLFNLSSMNFGASTGFSQITMSEGLNEDDNSVVFVGFSSSTFSYHLPSNTPMVIRVHRNTLAWETLVTFAACLPSSQLTSLRFSPIDRALLMSCEEGTAITAVFNGSMADPSSTVDTRTISNPRICLSDDIIRAESAFGFNAMKLIILCGDQGIAISTTGTSLSQTIPYVLCSNLFVVSSHVDEFGQNVLLHNCGRGAFPAVTVDGRPQQLSLCESPDPVLHRAGTSQIFARCSSTDGSSRFIVSVNSDDSSRKLLFECPEVVHNVFESIGSSQAIIAGNSSLVFVCGFTIWELPLPPQVGPARLLLNLTTAHATTIISGLQASSQFVFVSISSAAPIGWIGYFVIDLLSPTPQQFQMLNATRLFIEEEQNALWFEHNFADRYYLSRQQPLNDFSSGAQQLFLNISESLRGWTIDSLTDSLIAILSSGELWILPTSQVTPQVDARKIQIMPTSCIISDAFTSVEIIVHHLMGIILIPCDLTESSYTPDWTLVAMPIRALTNSSASVEWLPVLRGSTQCPELEHTVFTPNSTALYLSCNNDKYGMAWYFTMNFQCAPGQQLWLGGCQDCISGWNKPLLVGSTDTTPVAALDIPQCTRCAPGSIAVQSGSFVCLPCAVGTFHDSDLGEVCRPCPAGRYQNTSGSTACAACDSGSGTYAPSQGSVTCSTCPLGSIPDPHAVTCVACPRGSYTPSNSATGLTQCVSCEGSHQNGLDCSAGLASVRAGYFAFLINEADGSIVRNVSDGETKIVNAVFHTASCPFNVCPGSSLQLPSEAAINGSVASSCPPDDPQSGPIHYCCWPRLNHPANILCAECVDGHIPWANSCTKCSGPNGGLITLLLLFSFGLIAWLYTNASNSSFVSSAGVSRNTSGHVTTLLYFVQICSLQLGRASDWINWMHWSNLSASSTSQCIASLDAYEQTALNLAVPLILTSILLVMALIHGTYDRCFSRRSRSTTIIDPHPDELHVDMQRAGIAQQIALRQPLASSLEVDAMRELEEMNSPGLSADSWSSQYSMSFRDPTVDASSISFDSLWSPLYGCYSSSAWYWNSFVLSRRVLFSACAVFLADSPSTRFALFTFLHFLSLIMHQMAAPYTLKQLNFVESGSYSILLLVSVALSVESPPYLLWFELIITITLTACTLSMIGWIAWLKLRKSPTKLASSESDNRWMSFLLRVLAILVPSRFSLRRYFRTFLLLMLFCYTSVTSTVLSFLHCVDISSDVKLVFAAPTIDCTSDRYQRYQIWVIIVLVCYTIAFPVATLALLAWNRTRSRA